MKRFALLFILLYATGEKISGQKFSFGFQLVGLSYHLQKSPHPFLYKGKITQNGRMVANLGISLTFRYHAFKQWGFQYSQALVAHDCSGRFLGMSHVGVFGSHENLFGTPHAVDMSFGPMFFYRRNWALLPGYVDTGLFKISADQKWMTKFVWHGGTISWRYRMHSGEYFKLDMLPGIPELISVAPGLSFQPSFR